MNATPSTHRPRPLVSAFRLVANLEAASWAGLLTGMLFKYVLSGHGVLGAELVTLFGRLHGVLVVIYAALALATAWRLRWSLPTAGLAVAATIPPFATVAFDVWAHRSGRYAPRAATPARAGRSDGRSA